MNKTNDLLISTKYKFLVDKKWWTEEDENDITLFVEYKGIVFKEKMSKHFFNFVKNRKPDKRTNGIQKATVGILLTGIKKQIIDCWVEALESSLEKA